MQCYAKVISNTLRCLVRWCANVFSKEMLSCLVWEVVALYCVIVYREVIDVRGSDKDDILFFKNYFYICIEMRIIVSAIISILLTLIWLQAKKHDEDL